jgi:hypothetical protein
MPHSRATVSRKSRPPKWSLVRDARGSPEALRSPGRLPWATVLRRAFAIDVRECPRCAGYRRIVGAVTKPHAVRCLLGALELTAQLPPGRPVTAS